MFSDSGKAPAFQQTWAENDQSTTKSWHLGASFQDLHAWA